MAPTRYVDRHAIATSSRTAIWSVLTANGECAQVNNLAFGSAVPTEQFDPDLITGFNHRQSNWETSVSVVHELVPRVGIDVGYFRRSWTNFRVTDNLALTPADFTQYDIVNPVDPRLGDDSGATVRGFVDVVPTKFGQVNNFNTLSTKIGDQTEVWQGVDFTINARLQNGLSLQGGISTGSTHENDCDILTALPEMRNMAAIAAANRPASQRPLQYCDRKSPYLTQAKLFGVYIIPKVEVQVSGTFRSVPGQIQGNIAENFAQVALVATNPFLATNSNPGPAAVGERAERDAADSGAAGALPRSPQRARPPRRQAAARGPAPGARQHRLLQRAQLQRRGQRQPGVQPGGDRRRAGVLLAADRDPERADDEVHRHV